MSEKKINKKSAKTPVPIEFDLAVINVDEPKVNFHTTTTKRTRDIIARLAELHSKSSMGVVLDEVSERLFKAAVKMSYDEWMNKGCPSLTNIDAKAKK